MSQAATCRREGSSLRCKSRTDGEAGEEYRRHARIAVPEQALHALEDLRRNDGRRVAGDALR